jgi:hypothetical protein
MALYPLQAQNPFGQFDGLDTEATTLKGGEIVGFGRVNKDATPDKGAFDLADGYVGLAIKYRPVITKTLTAGMRPLFLADEGTAKYGTLFGEVVGATVGQVVSGGTQLGPHTATGSGKVTVWGTPGIYGVTLDSVDTTAATGLSTENATLTVGAALYATSAGLLTPNAGAAFEAVVVARFIEFTTNGSLVTSTKAQVSALNSPVGGAAERLGLTQAVISFQGVDG